MKKEGSSDYYPPDEESAPLNQQPAPSAPQQYYGTFQGTPAYPQPLPPGFPHPVHPSEHYRGGTVPGYPVVEGTPELRRERLPCCGIGIGWCLFILGWILASVPWYVGVFLLVCTRPDPRERIGLVCCTIAAVLSLIAIIVGGTTADS
eukprot:c22374_g1_i2 orf=170-613(+)